MCVRVAHKKMDTKRESCYLGINVLDDLTNLAKSSRGENNESMEPSKPGLIRRSLSINRKNS